MSLTQRITDLATRVGQEIKLKPSKSANEVITGKWEMAQHGVQVVTNLSAPNSGYVGFAAKADGLYQKIGAASDLRLLTTSDAVSYQPVDADLTAIAGVGGDVGFLRKTDVNTWTLDTSTYALSTHTHAGAYAALAGSLTQAFSASQINLEGGYYDWTIGQSSGNLNFAQYTTSFQFHSSGITCGPATANTLAYFDGNKILKSLPSPTVTEIGYLNGVTSAIQTQLGARALLAGSSTQAFSTHHLTLGNSSGNGPILTLYGSSASVFSTIKTTNGNLYIDAAAASGLYLNYYAGTGGVVFGNGNTGLSGASVSAAGLYTGTGLTVTGAITAASVKITTGAGVGKILTSDADGDATWSAPSATVPAASETSPGIVEIATTAEVLAMTDMLRSLTPYTLANAFPNSTGNNGYISIPIGFGERILIQYGSFSANGNGTVSFPIAFPYYCHSVVITAGDGIARIPSRTRFSFVWQDVQDAITSGNPCYWMAIGK